MGCLFTFLFILVIVPRAAILDGNRAAKKEDNLKRKLADYLQSLKFDMGNYVRCDISLSRKLYYIENKSKTEVMVLEYSSDKIELKYRTNFTFNVSIYNFKAMDMNDYQTKYGLFINENDRKILIVEYKKESNEFLRERLLEWSDILAVELLRRNKTVSEKSTMSTIGRSVVGGVIGGGVGAIIGGSTASTQSVSFDNSYGVRITLRKLDDPNVEVEFCSKNEDKIAKTNQAEKDTQHLYQLCSIIIDSESKK